MDNISSVKRYHLAKVYRRDQPAVQKGRMREFFQCDFDIAGDYDPMIPDAEIIRIINEVFTQLEIGEFTIKINHRKILDGVFEVCGVPSDKVRSISSAVDKLDKLPWEQVKSEMVEIKGLEEGVADRIYGYVRLNGGRELLEKLKADTNLQGNVSCQQGLSDMTLLFNYIDALNAAKNVSFDLSLARGLDYYTGLIFEVITSASAPPPPPSTVITSNTSSKKKKPENPDEDISESVGVGSICGGGRYDDLVGRFAGETRQIPCVGMSVGIERVFAILKAKHAENTVRASDTQVFVMAMGNVSVEARLAIMTELWDAGISVCFLCEGG
jgi:histidyl-tRNA synthetase